MKNITLNAKNECAYALIWWWYFYVSLLVFFFSLICELRPQRIFNEPKQLKLLKKVLTNTFDKLSGIISQNIMKISSLSGDTFRYVHLNIDSIMQKQ